MSNQAGHDNWVRALVFHPSGKYLLSASDDGTIRVWELATGRCVKTVQAHSHFVTCLAWGRQLASSGAAKTNGAERDGERERERCGGATTNIPMPPSKLAAGVHY